MKHHTHHYRRIALFVSFASALTRTVVIDGFVLGGATIQHQQQQHQQKDYRFWNLQATSQSNNEDLDNDAVSSTTTGEAPQVLATGYSQAMELVTALEEAMEMALEALPPAATNTNSIATTKIDLAIVSISSLYDGNSKPSDVVPTLLKAASRYGQGIQNLIGGTNGGFVSSIANTSASTSTWDDTSKDKTYPKKIIDDRGVNDGDDDDDDDDDNSSVFKACRPFEREGVPGVTVTLAVLPDVNVQTFHVMGDDLPDDSSQISTEDWKASVGLENLRLPTEDGQEHNSYGNASVMVIPSPAFQKKLDTLLRGLELHVSPRIFGAIASTVSSLSRARLFRYDSRQGDSCIQTLSDGCVGVVLSGDIEIQMMIAQGAKPVGGVYQIVKGQETTISAIALDEAATKMVRSVEECLQDEEEIENDDDQTTSAMDNKAKLAQAYAKARIPKPVLAEANFLMKAMSDDDQEFMRKTLLVGLERRGASGGQTLSELESLAEGKGPGFTVHQVASASSKDGSITLPLGSVDIKPGQRLRFFVRESPFAKRELEALWTGYKRQTSTQTIQSENGDGTAKPSFTPIGCFLFPTLDRGNKFFAGKEGYESQTVTEYLPTVPSISGFFSNGVIGSLDAVSEQYRERTRVFGSASGYVLLGSSRPIYVPRRAAAEAAKTRERKAQKEVEEEREEEEANSLDIRVKGFDDSEKRAPRDTDGELILRRREIHSGRAMTVSTVEWSVAEKTATPTSTLEGFMWDKETEVDRFRERVPLSNLVSQCRLSAVDPSNPKPRDWIGPIKDAATKGFVIIPECKRMEPETGSLRKRYDVSKLSKEFTMAGVPAISVNCDGALFGGSLEDLTIALEGTTKAAVEMNDSDDGVVVPPILASDLVLYPYQLYKMRLAGADAVNLMVAALEAKDLVYLTKIAASMQMQTFITVTSTQQIEDLALISAGGVNGLIVSNRNLEDFSFDMTGQQALNILRSDALKNFREKHGDENIIILAEGRIGIATGKKKGGSPEDYIKALHQAGAIGAIVGTGLVPDETGKSPLESLLQASQRSG